MMEGLQLRRKIPLIRDKCITKNKNKKTEKQRNNRCIQREKVSHHGMKKIPHQKRKVKPDDNNKNLQSVKVM